MLYAVRRRGVTLQLRDRYRRVHDFLEHKWYFDELYDAVFVRPIEPRLVRPARDRDRLRPGLHRGRRHRHIVRAGTSVARAIQTGYLRAYALLLLLGAALVVLYFLIASS